MSDISSQTIAATNAAASQLAKTHYENFPVASVLLPRRYRHAVRMIYAFSRQADDFADEGDYTPEQRLQLLSDFRGELDCIAQKQPPQTAFFASLAQTIVQHNLPLQPFYDLLDAFSQDVTKSRYENFGEVMDYCRRSANPVGRLLLHLYGHATPQNIGMGDAICSSLQLINFLQDIAIDYKKNRIYLPQDELAKFKITEADIARGKHEGAWALMMEFQINRARKLLQSGAPLGLALPGRLGLEMRAIIAGGERTLKKIHDVRGDVFNQRPVLHWKDRMYIIYRAVRAK